MWLGTLSLGSRMLDSNSEIHPPPPSQEREVLCPRRHSKEGADAEHGLRTLSLCHLRVSGHPLGSGIGGGKMRGIQLGD